MPLKSGYSYATVRENIALMMRDGYQKSVAAAAALSLARRSYFKRYPHGALPLGLAHPKTHRLRDHYNARGESLHVNPTRELNLSSRQRAAIRGAVSRIGGNGELNKAAKLYADFTGHDDLTVRKIRVSSLPRVALDIGHVTGIMYQTVRDGRTEHYIHRFKAASRPLLAASSDGKRLYLLGGAYDFTERGIVDRN